MIIVPTPSTNLATQAQLPIQAFVQASALGTLITGGNAGASLVTIGTTGNAAATAGAAALNTQSGTITSEALTTAAGLDYVLTLANSKITGPSVVLASADNGSNTTEGIAINRVTPGTGSVVIHVRNTNASVAWNGTIKIRYLVAC